MDSQIAQQRFDSQIAYQKFARERLAEIAAVQRCRKQLNEREVLILSALTWLKGLRDQHPDLAAQLGDDAELYRVAGRVIAVVFGDA